MGLAYLSLLHPRHLTWSPWWPTAHWMSSVIRSWDSMWMPNTTQHQNSNGLSTPSSIFLWKRLYTHHLSTEWMLFLMITFSDDTSYVFWLDFQALFLQILQRFPQKHQYSSPARGQSSAGEKKNIQVQDNLVGIHFHWWDINWAIRMHVSVISRSSHLHLYCLHTLFPQISLQCITS